MPGSFHPDSKFRTTEKVYFEISFIHIRERWCSASLRERASILDSQGFLQSGQRYVFKYNILHCHIETKPRKMYKHIKNCILLSHVTLCWKSKSNVCGIVFLNVLLDHHLCYHFLILQAAKDKFILVKTKYYFSLRPNMRFRDLEVLEALNLLIFSFHKGPTLKEI